MTNYRRGREREYRTQRILESAGYETIRTAGSHGPVDVIAFGVPSSVRFVQVKSGSGRISPQGLEALLAIRDTLPNGCSVEVWSFPYRSRQPQVDIL